LIIICFAIIGPDFIGAQDTITKKEIKKQKASYLIPVRPWTFEVPLWTPGFAGSFAYCDIDIECEDGGDPENPIESPPAWHFNKVK